MTKWSDDEVERLWQVLAEAGRDGWTGKPDWRRITEQYNGPPWHYYLRSETAVRVKAGKLHRAGKAYPWDAPAPAVVATPTAPTTAVADLLPEEPSLEERVTRLERRTLLLEHAGSAVPGLRSVDNIRAELGLAPLGITAARPAAEAVVWGAQPNFTSIVGTM